MKSSKASWGFVCSLPFSLLDNSEEEPEHHHSSFLLHRQSSHSLSAAAICASRGEWFTNLKARVTDADDGLAEGGRKVATPKRKKFLNGVAAAATRVGWLGPITECGGKMLKVAAARMRDEFGEGEWMERGWRLLFSIVQ